MNTLSYVLVAVCDQQLRKSIHWVFIQFSFQYSLQYSHWFSAKYSQVASQENLENLFTRTLYEVGRGDILGLGFFDVLSPMLVMTLYLADHSHPPGLIPALTVEVPPLKIPI